MEKRINKFKLNDFIEGLYMLKELTNGTTTAGNPYIRGTLTDHTGEIQFVMWDVDEQSRKIESGTIVKVSGMITSYKDVKQIKCDLIMKADMSQVGDLSLYMPGTDETPESMWQYLFSKTDAIRCMELKLAVQEILNENKTKLLSMPGSKMVHHDVIGGLLAHTKGVVDNATAIAANYKDIDMDLVIAGATLHDIGKLWEFDQSELGLVSDYSVVGNLYGHLYIGAKYVSEICKQNNVDDERHMLLEHIILSHHGERDKGTIVEPKTREAYIVHMADELDAKLNVFDKALSKTDEGKMSDKQFALDNVRIYKTKENKESL